MQVRHFDIWSKYNLRLPLDHHRTCSQHKKLDEAWARIERYLFTRSSTNSKLFGDYWTAIITSLRLRNGGVLGSL